MWQAGQACIRADFGAPSVDMAGALAMTTGAGVPADVAGPLLAAYRDGLLAGVAQRREREEQNGLPDHSEPHGHADR